MIYLIQFLNASLDIKNTFNKLTLECTTLSEIRKKLLHVHVGSKHLNGPIVIKFREIMLNNR